MEKRVQDELNLLRDIIVSTVPVKQIYLFGSYADGVPHKDSDLDLFVIMKDTALIRDIDAIIQIRQAIRDKKTMPVDVIVMKDEAFNVRKTAPTIERHIAQNGVLLYG